MLLLRLVGAIALFFVILVCVAEAVNAEYRIGFAPLGGRLRNRHAIVLGLDQLTTFLRQTHAPTPDIERAWRALAARRVHSIARVGLTPTKIAALGF